MRYCAKRKILAIAKVRSIWDPCKTRHSVVQLKSPWKHSGFWPRDHHRPSAGSRTPDFLTRLRRKTSPHSYLWTIGDLSQIARTRRELHDPTPILWIPNCWTPCHLIPRNRIAYLPDNGSRRGSTSNDEISPKTQCGFLLHR